jgi:hypothetical protein
MDRTNSRIANLSPCIRLFIELLLKEVDELNSSECAVSVLLQETKALEQYAWMEKDTWLNLQ